MRITRIYIHYYKRCEDLKLLRCASIVMHIDSIIYIYMCIYMYVYMNTHILL